MLHQRQHLNSILNLALRPVLSSLAAMMMFMLAVAAQPVSAQTYTVIHNFSGGGDGANPYGGLAIDGGGNLYGTTALGGAGYGGAFKLKRGTFGFTFNPLYTFTGGSDGASPVSGVVFGRNGSLYGTAHAGGEQNCANFVNPGCGLVFNLKPPATFCRSALCPWTETVLYRFTGASDGASPWGNVAFDNSGNLYGTTQFGGITSCINGCGTVFELMPSGGSWTETVLYSFTNGGDGSRPYAGVTFDASGNLYGTNFWAAGGGCEGQGCGTVYQLTPSGSGWTHNTIYAYQGGSDGGLPVGGVIFDPSGNLYTSTLSYGSGGTGTVLELSPSGGNWTFNLLFTLSGFSRGGPEASLVMDQAGNLYGTAIGAGAHCCGSVFKLTPSGGNWIYTSLHDFTGSTDGGEPVSTVVFDADGNLYGTATLGGASGKGVVWKITP